MALKLPWSKDQMNIYWMNKGIFTRWHTETRPYIIGGIFLQIFKVENGITQFSFDR